jgi:hypothetical protein
MITEEQYRELPGVRWSHLREMRKSPKHYLWATQNQRDTASLKLGRAGHVAILDPEAFESDHIEYTATKQRRGKVWEAFEAEHADKAILSRDEWARALCMRDAVNANGLAAELIADAASIETCVEWIDPFTRLECKARLDVVTNAGWKVEIKTTRAIEPKWFAADCARFGYHGQSAFHGDGLESAKRIDAKPLPDCFKPIRIQKHAVIAVESSAPYDVAVYDFDADTIEAGRDLYRSSLTRVAECIATDVWPGVVPGNEVRTLQLPPWAVASGPTDIQIDGETVSL